MIIKGKKITLRPQRLSDAARYVKWFKDKEVTRYTSTENVTLAAEKKFLRKMINNKQSYHFAIEASDGTHIGATALNYENPRVYELGIIIGDKRYWNQGYGSTVVDTLIHFAFTKTKAKKIELSVFKGNARALKVYKRCGFKIEGLRKKHIFKRGKLEDDYLMGLLKK